MKTFGFLLLGWALLLAHVPAASAAPKKATLGVFLPTTLADGQQRFEFAERLAARLSESLGQPVAAKSFGRFEDFSKAVSDGLVDFAVVDSWAVAQLGGRVTAVAFAALSGETFQRWAIISNAKGSVKDLNGKRLALTKGAGPSDPKFVSHVIFAGDLDAQRHFRLVSVPNVESALKMLEAKGAEAALVPLSLVPKDVRVLYRSAKVPGALLVNLRGSADDLEGSVRQLGAVAPFDAFVPVQGREFEDFRRLVQQGPPRRQPALVESPELRADVDALVKTEEFSPVFPSFTDALEVSSEQPDD